MAFSLVASVGAKSTDGNGFTSGSIDTTGATLIVLELSNFIGVTTSMAISDSKSNTYLPLTAQDGGFADNERSRLYYCINPTVGSGHTFTVGTNTTFASIVAAAFSATSPAFDQESGNTGASITSLAPGSLTPPSNNALIVTGLSLRGLLGVGQTPSVDGGFTSLNYQTGVSGQCLGGGLGYLIQGTAAAAIPAWSWATADSAAATAATFTIPGSGGVFPPIPYLQHVAGMGGGF